MEGRVVGGWTVGHAFVVVFCAAAEEFCWFGGLGGWGHCFGRVGID